MIFCITNNSEYPLTTRANIALLEAIVSQAWGFHIYLILSPVAFRFMYLELLGTHYNAYVYAPICDPVLLPKPLESFTSNLTFKTLYNVLGITDFQSY
jgi:hypothetical protein